MQWRDTISNISVRTFWKTMVFKSVEVTRGSGDYGVDVLAEKEGVTYAVQCKRYDGPVGVKAVQEAYAGGIITTGWWVL